MQVWQILFAGYFEQQHIASTVHIVTRLDRDTSGLICIAKHRHIHHLMRISKKRERFIENMKQLYMGMSNKQSIIAPIGRKDTSIIEREVRADGQFAHTDVYGC